MLGSWIKINHTPHNRTSTMDKKPAVFHKPLKCNKPTIKTVLLRNRLFDGLSDAFSEHQVVWLVAPAGYGKTTLSASYTDSIKKTCIWYHIDKGDIDPAYFFEHFTNAAEIRNIRDQRPGRFQARIYWWNRRICAPIFSVGFTKMC